MPHFTTDRVKLSAEWQPVPNYSKRVTKDGQTYQLVSKYQREYSTSERAKRASLGALAYSASFFTSKFTPKEIDKLLNDKYEKIRFANDLSVKDAPLMNTNDQFEQSRKILEQGIVISEETILQLQPLLKGDKFSDISVDAAPDLTFKLYPFESTFQEMVDNQTFLTKEHLNLLKLPPTKFFTLKYEGRNYPFLATKKLDFDAAAQKKLHAENAEFLQETIKQLALFICKTGRSPISWIYKGFSQIPVLKETNNVIGLPNVWKENTAISLFGSRERYGLADFVDKRSHASIVEIAKAHQIDTSPFEEAEISQKELEAGIALSEKEVSDLQPIVAEIVKGNTPEGVTKYDSNVSNHVFSLEKHPGLIFKIGNASARYKKMIEAQTFIRKESLGLLKLPHAKLFNGILAEEMLNFNPRTSMQEELFEEGGAALDKTIEQLALFICKTGFSDVEWRNIPIIDKNKIALIDVEEMVANPAVGLFGGYVDGGGRTGLVRLVNETQGKIVLAVAQKCGVNTKEFQWGFDRRKEDLKESQDIKAFHKKRGVQGNEPLEVDFENLGLDEKSKNGAKMVVESINTQMQGKDPRDSVKEKRKVKVGYSSKESHKMNLSSDRYTQILKALEANGYIFKWTTDGSYDFKVQA